ncbi:MAG: flagellin [Porticoccaceae bacterium]|nr:flagellin [Porticoccaceae bacterium]
MTVINTNVGATITQNALAKNDRLMGQAMERLSTGKRINSASDDAAGLAISARMTAQIKGLDQAARNGNDAIAMIQTADGASIEVANMLQRMRELAIQSITETNTATDRSNLSVEFVALQSEISRISTTTQWNGETILDGSAGTLANGVVSYQVGSNADQTIDVDLGNWAPTGGDVFSTDISANGIGLDTPEDRAAALATIDTAINGINTQRASYGATMNRLEYVVDNLANVSQNAAASRSRVEDADYAIETTELARTQIIQQAGTAMLAQANQSAQSVLQLLKG